LHVNLIDLADNNYIVENVNCAKFPDSMQEKIQPLVTKYKLHVGE
jgi:hypothetical protein